MKTKKVAFGFAIVLVGLVAAASNSIACAKHEYEQCVFGRCACLPKIGGTMGKAAEHVKNEFKGQAGGGTIGELDS